MYVLSQKPLKKYGSILFNIFFTQLRENYSGSQDNALTPTNTFKTILFIYTLLIWHIYFGLHQIWAQLEKFAICLARHSLLITGLQTDFVWTWPHIIIFPLFLLKGNTIMPITPKADCAALIPSTIPNTTKTAITAINAGCQQQDHQRVMVDPMLLIV